MLKIKDLGITWLFSCLVVRQGRMNSYRKGGYWLPSGGTYFDPFSKENEYGPMGKLRPVEKKPHSVPHEEVTVGHPSHG